MLEQFGAKPGKEWIAQYAQSPQWRDGLFHNLEFTDMKFSLSKLPGLIYRQLWETNGRYPANPIPVTKFSVEQFLAASEEAKIIWYGHSAILLRIAGKTILIDPMLGPDAAPTAPFKIKRFSQDTLSILDDLPPVDLLLLSHDHYDHLDLASIRKLKSKVKHYYTALGVARHLISWGIDRSTITEFDWWQEQRTDDLKITFTPSRHFSGRGLTDRFKSLWGGWVIQSPRENIYFSGDSGYGAHFKEIGRRLGPFDFGFMECGQYNENWHLIHMFPEESIQAALDAQVRKAMAVHWGAFALALHSWKDPIERFTQEGKSKSLPLTDSKPGELFTIRETKSTQWWNTLE